MNGFVGRGRHIEQEQGCDVASFFLARLVKAAVGSLAHQTRDPRFDSSIDIDFLAVLEPANHPV